MMHKVHNSKINIFISWNLLQPYEPFKIRFCMRGGDACRGETNSQARLQICLLTLSPSMQQIHSHISFLKPWGYWIFANINPWFYVPLPYSSKKFREETLLGILEVFQWCFPTYFLHRDNKGVQSFGSAPWHQQMFSHNSCPLQISCDFHSLEQSFSRDSPLAKV